MKRFLFLTSAFLICKMVSAQVAKWLIPPSYDNIYMARGAELIVTDSVTDSGKIKTIWTKEGERLATTQDWLMPFSEGHAVTVEPKTSIITGILTEDGSFLSLSDYSAVQSVPFFSNHSLLVKDGPFYRFLDYQGKPSRGVYMKALPFINGYASCVAYHNLQKKKDPYNLLLSKEYNEVVFSYRDKVFSNDDIEFISSVNDENIGIVVIKHRIYYFNGIEKSLTPVFANKEETNEKNQAKLDKDISQCLETQGDSTYILTAKCGKNDWVEIKLNSLFMPIDVKSSNHNYHFNKQIVLPRKYETPITRTESQGKVGIFWKETEILPPQLDELLTCYSENALVKMSGKYGLLKILPQESFQLSMNQGVPIAFRHHIYNTKIRLDLPKIISASNARIEINPQSGCSVDLTSGEKKNTEFGNFIEYRCELSIPESLPDEMLDDASNEIVYPTQIIYNGLISPVIPFKIKAWHYKYFNIDIIDSETTFGQGSMSFTFNTNAEREMGETVYPVKVNVTADSLACELEKISETRYKCKIQNLLEGTNNIFVSILEEGCPPVVFPFEVTYVKPVAKSKDKPAVTENVVIKKKTKARSLSKLPSTSLPHIEI